jgi:hypothetical protein
MDVAKIRTALGVKVHPQLQSFDLQIFQVDVPAQVERVEIFRSGRWPVSDSIFPSFSAVCASYNSTPSISTVWGEIARVESLDLSADAVSGERVSDLAGDITVDITQADIRSGRSEVSRRAPRPSRFPK